PVCQVGLVLEQAIVSDVALLAGLFPTLRRPIISVASVFHQFCRVGQLAMVGGQAHISQDVLPFVMIDGLSSEVVGLNRIGLRRSGYAREDILQLKKAYRVIYRSELTFGEILQTLQQQFPTGPAAAFFEFMLAGKRGFVRERRAPPKSTIKLFPSDDREGSDDEAEAVRNAG
ncbi:MAG: hypothetical protein H8E44_13340, partial [Planctomycetes bacterium]|nr:hypothetical protein [Planctomycetota bacterium]